jgi:hypothetical protein
MLQTALSTCDPDIGERARALPRDTSPGPAPGGGFATVRAEHLAGREPLGEALLVGVARAATGLRTTG